MAEPVSPINARVLGAKLLSAATRAAQVAVAAQERAATLNAAQTPPAAPAAGSVALSGSQPAPGPNRAGT